jgi:hypothetical protein
MENKPSNMIQLEETNAMVVSLDHEVEWSERGASAK